VLLGVIACFVALCGLALSVFNLLDSRNVVRKSELSPTLDEKAEALSKDYARQLRSIEAEWDDMYAKFSRLAGRADRMRALTTPAPTAEVAADPVIRPQSHTEVLRKWRAK